MNPSGEISHASLKFLQRKFPYTSERPVAELLNLKIRYAKYGTLYVIVAMTLFFLLPVIYGYLGHLVYLFIARLTTSGGDVFYAPTWMSFVITGFLWALATLIFAAEWCMRIILRYRFDEFEDYYNDNQGYDNHKAGIYIAKIMFVISFLTFPFTFSQHIITDSKGIRLKTLTDFFERSYNYSDINRIVFYKSYQDKQGVITPMPDYYLYFKDGYKFAPLFYFDDIELAQPFITNVSEHAHVLVDTIAVKAHK